MKYIRREKRQGENVWVFYPPEDVKIAKVLTKRTFNTYHQARSAHEGLVRTVERFRRGEIPGKVLTPSNTVSQAVSAYLSTPHLRSLSRSSVKGYTETLRNVCETNLGRKTFGEVRLKDLNPQMCQYVYSIWLDENSKYGANRNKLLFGMLMTYLMGLDIMTRNPMASVKAVKHEPKSIIWTEDQVEKFLDVAFSDFKWRSVGLAVAMMYEWGQRPKDILSLKWNALDFDNNCVTITQSKRGATVTLPINDNLKEMLLKQKEDYDFQDYVVPTLSSDRRYIPYNRATFTAHVNTILELADLPKELSAGYLRKSAIQELIEAGVDSAQIMSVTGHRNIRSLNPYIKHTLKAASSALEKRKSAKEY